jgi:hypothetical protein
MPSMHDFMMDTFATPSSSQVASLFDDEAGMSHGVEGHQGPDGDAGVAHDSTGPQDLMVRRAGTRWSNRPPGSGCRGS